MSSDLGREKIEDTNKLATKLTENSERHILFTNIAGKNIFRILKNHNKEVADIPESMMQKQTNLEEAQQLNGIEQDIQQSSAKLSSIKLFPRKRKASFHNYAENNLKSESPESRLTDLKKETYHKGGLVHSLHGNIYQLKLQMLFLKRALDKGYEFNLGTEVEDAEKFDDVVFKYKSKDNSRKDEIRFVQVKHKQDESKRITAHDLLTDKDDDFSLQKYFISYSKIKKKHGFNNSELKDFILYTNIKFDSADLEKAEIKIEEMEANDDILDTKSDKSAVLTRLIIQKEHKLYEKLRETSDSYLLAKKLVQHISDGKPLQLSTDIFKLYHVALCGTVFQIQETKVQNKKGNFVPKKYVKFRDDFLNGNNLTEDVRNFRNVFQLVSKKQNDAFWQELNGKELRVTSNFGQIFKLERNPIISEPEILAEKIAEIINNAKQKTINIHRKTGVIKENIDKLAGHILVQDEEDLMRFRKLFFDNENMLPGNLEKFKDALNEAFEMKGIDFTVLRRYKYKISNFRTCEETLEGKLLYSKPTLPNDKVADEEITEFFEKLVFAVGQPNEVELGEIITKEIGEDSKFNLLNADLVAYSFQGKMLEWFKEKRSEKGKEGIWLNAESGKEFFDLMERQVSSLISVGLNLPYSERLQAYGITFDVKNLFNKLKTFLSKENNIFYIITPENTILSAINIDSALAKLKNQEEFAQYNQEDSYIFMRLNILLRPKTKKHVMDAFKSKNNHNLLIIDCESEALENQIQEIEELYNYLNEVIRSNKNKKIIFINTKDNAVLLKKVTNSTTYKSEVDNSGFNDLTKESQQKLLERQIIFQGQKISLNKLIEESDESSKQIIDVNTLVHLITGEEIEIGSKPPGTSDLKGAYSEVFEEIELTTFVDKLLSQKSNDVYIISGIPGSNKESELIKSINGNMEESKLNDLRRKIGVFNQQNMKTAIDPRIQVADDQFKEKDFKQICHNNPERKIYWIILKNENDKSVFMLAQIYNPAFYLDGQRFNNEVVIEKDVKEQLGSCTLSEIFIIGVKGKSEVTRWLQFTNIQEQRHFEKNCQNNKIKFVTSQHNLEVYFQKEIKQIKAKTFNLLKFVRGQLIWCKTYGSLENLSKYRRKCYRNTKPVIGEDDLIKEIKDKKVSIIAGDPGMGKSTTLIKLYGLKYELQTGIEESITKSHWVIRINLKDHLECIRNTYFSNSQLETEMVRKITDFLSQVDKNLSDDFARNLLGMALKTQHFTKPLLLGFDGFDEVLDKTDRDKIISLLTLLKNTTEAKCWITTRLHYEETLENALSTFAIELDPMDDLTTKKFIKKYLRNCLSLMLSQSEFKEIFDNSDEVVENSRVQEYTDAFLRKMREVFKGDVSEFIGTPLQLYLMLEGSTGHFKEWVRDDNLHSPDFSYLGNDIWEIYENFIDRKYKIYFKKTGVAAALRQEQDKETFDGYHNDLAKSLIFKLKPKENLKKFKDIALSAGVIKSDGGDIDFIHPTFREYFTAKVLIHWIGKWKEENLSVFRQVKKKQEYVLKEILLKPDYKVIRAFLNAKLFAEKMTNILLPEEYYDKGLLFQTARENNVGIASFVLDNFKDANVNVRDKDGKTVLFRATKFGNLEMVKFLVSKGANVNAINKDGNTVLHIAAKSGHLEMVKFLVTKSANVNAINMDGNTVLHMPTEFGNLEIVVFLVTKGTDVDAIKRNDITLLQMAVFSKNWDIVQFLVANGVNIVATYKNGDTILHRAAKSGNLEMVVFLMDAGANINATNKLGYTVLHRAIESGNLEMLEFLVTKGVNVDSTEKGGLMLLPYAVLYRNWNAIPFLVAKGANVNATDKYGNTVVHYTARYGKWDILQFLVAKGANIDARNNCGITVLHWAAESGNLENVEFLVAQGANVNATDKDGDTVLHYAAINRNWNIVQCLVIRGANVDAMDKYRKTVLHSVAKSGNLDMVEFLVAKGANVNATDKDGNSVLQTAAFNDKWKVVQFLVSEIGYVNATNKNYYTSLHDAAKSCNLETLKALVPIGSNVDARNKDDKTDFHKCCRIC
ncbi:hypothetical protein ABEB36_011047 [Hypothenemus hampei]|uniref:Uncharacterized protein n=1 Tax=Hypothenemus hampei TaxID=57062 RepID=A0ABD1EE11_HYPHA